MPEITYPERVLFVMHTDGTLKAAHQERLTIITDADGKQITAYQHPAEPIDGAALVAVLPDQAALMAEVMALRTERDAVTAARDQAIKDLADASQVAAHQAETLAAHEADLASAQARIAEIEPALSAAQARIAELEASIPVPQAGVVSMRQARLALLGAGLLSAVDAAVAAMPNAAGDAARIEWEYAQDVRRDSPLVASLGDALGMSADELDALFATAATL